MAEQPPEDTGISDDKVDEVDVDEDEDEHVGHDPAGVRSALIRTAFHVGHTREARAMSSTKPEIVPGDADR